MKKSAGLAALALLGASLFLLFSSKTSTQDLPSVLAEGESQKIAAKGPQSLAGGSPDSGDREGRAEALKQELLAAQANASRDYAELYREPAGEAQRIEQKSVSGGADDSEKARKIVQEIDEAEAI